MSHNNLLGSILMQSSALALAVAATTAQKPSAADALLDAAKAKTDAEAAAALLDSRPVYTDEMRQDAVRVVQEWAETTDADLGDDEGLGDRLLGLIVGTAAEGDNAPTDDEAEYAASVAELAGDYLEGKGIPADDVDALVGDFDFPNELAERVHEALLDKLPQGDDAMMDDAGRFVDGEDDDKMLDATYRKTVAIRGGKKVRIKKRIAGTVRLSAKQKIAVRKMQRKAFSGAAKMHRAKSMRLRRKMGL